MQSKSQKHIDIVIEQITSFSPELLRDIQRLAITIGKNYKELQEKDLRDVLLFPNTALVVAKDMSHIIGMVTLTVYRIPYVRKAYVDDLVVDEKYRGMGIGTKLLEKVLLLAHEKGASYIDFTSRPERIESNRLYEKLGFTKRDTNVYRKIIDYEEV